MPAPVCRPVVMIYRALCPFSTFHLQNKGILHLVGFTRALLLLYFLRRYTGSYGNHHGKLTVQIVLYHTTRQLTAGSSTNCCLKTYTTPTFRIHSDFRSLSAAAFPCAFHKAGIYTHREGGGDRSGRCLMLALLGMGRGSNNKRDKDKEKETDCAATGAREGYLATTDGPTGRNLGTAGAVGESKLVPDSYSVEPAIML